MSAYVAPDSAPLPGPGSPPWAIFLDVDGTLLDIAERPGDVFVPPGLCQLLRQLRKLSGGALALVSGRQISVLDALLEWKTCDAAGCHGAEIRIDGRTSVMSVSGGWLTQIIPGLNEATNSVPGTYLEVKGHSVAFHYRNSTVSEGHIYALVERIVEPVRESARVLAGKCVMEVVPKDSGKDRAIAHLLNQPLYSRRVPVFAGDDATDEEAFGEVNRRGGLSIAIGRRSESEALFTLPNPSALRWWIWEVTHALSVIGPRR